MSKHGRLLKWHDHTAAFLAALATAHAIGLIDLAGWLPQGLVAMQGNSGLIMAAAVCGLVYALVLTTFYRRRLVKGPLYRCAETRPSRAFGHTYQSGDSRLLDSWQYR